MTSSPRKFDAPTLAGGDRPVKCPLGIRLDDKTQDER